MTSHNLNEKEIWKYVSKSLSHWGITYIDCASLKAARNNESEVSPYFLQLAFDLSILHLTNYQFTIDELGIQLSADDPVIQDLVISHLCEINCPFLKHIDNQVTFNFSSSRELLLTCGWLMGVSDIFGKISQKLIPKILKQIASSKSKVKPIKGNSSKKNHLQFIKANTSKTDTISYLYKILSNKEQKISNLQNKKIKLHEKWRKKIDSYNKNHGSHIILQSILAQNDGTQISEKQQKLLELLDHEKESMDQRKYFWVWLHQKVMKKQLQQMKQVYPDEQLYENMNMKMKKNNLQNSISVDSDYLVKFVRKCKQLQEQVDEVNIQIESIEEELNVKNPKNYKLLEREINDEIKKINESVLIEHSQDSKPSFVGAQLKKYIKKKGFTLAQRQKNKVKKQNKANRQMQENLKQQVEMFISQIDAVKFM